MPGGMSSSKDLLRTPLDAIMRATRNARKAGDQFQLERVETQMHPQIPDTSSTVCTVRGPAPGPASCRIGPYKNVLWRYDHAQQSANPAVPRRQTSGNYRLQNLDGCIAPAAEAILAPLFRVQPFRPIHEAQRILTEHDKGIPERPTHPGRVFRR